MESITIKDVARIGTDLRRGSQYGFPRDQQSSGYQSGDKGNDHAGHQGKPLCSKQQCP